MVEWIVNHHIGDDLWEMLMNSTRIHLPDDSWLKMEYLIRFGDDRSYVRDNPGRYDEPSDWAELAGAFGSLRLSGQPSYIMRTKNVYQTAIALKAYTTHGVMFSYELRQNKDEPANVGPIRVPVPDDMIQEVRDWVDSSTSPDGLEVARVKGVIFEERFAEASPSNATIPPGSLNDVHLKAREVDDSDVILDVIEKAMDFTERADRML